MNKYFTITVKEAGQRLDKFLSEILPHLSRLAIKEEIKQGGFLVNGKIAKSSRRLKENDAVEIKIEYEKTERKIQPNPKIKLDIIYEDADAIVIDKPAGLSVHPRQDKNGWPITSELNSTLISGLLAYYPPLASVGDPSTGSTGSPQANSGQALRPGIVHRLDKDTSGVMIVAKNQKSFDWLKKQFQERKVQKKYIALVVGNPPKENDVIRTLVARSESDPTKQKVIPLTNADRRIMRINTDIKKPGAKEKEAITKYRVIKNLGKFSLLEAIPKTGRMHQIRVQLAWLSFPVAGDLKYGPKKRPSPRGLKRQFLHSSELTIVLPSGSKKTFISPLPPDLKTVTDALDPVRNSAMVPKDRIKSGESPNGLF